MSKTWFLDCICKSVPKSRVREMCRLMELSERDTRLVLERFCDGKGMEQCGDFYSADLQKKNMPDLDCKVRGWVDHNTGFFSIKEHQGIARHTMRRAELD